MQRRNTGYSGYDPYNRMLSDDGRYMAFQMAKVGDPASVGRGIFMYDFEKGRKRR